MRKNIFAMFAIALFAASAMLVPQAIADDGAEVAPVDAPVDDDAEDDGAEVAPVDDEEAPAAE